MRFLVRSFLCLLVWVAAPRVFAQAVLADPDSGTIEAANPRLDYLQRQLASIAIKGVPELFAQAAPADADADSTAASNLRLERLARQLASVAVLQEKNEAELAATQQAIATTSVLDADAIKGLKRRHTELTERRAELRDTFEELATGGLKISDFRSKSGPKPFDWQAELLDIFKPMIAELKVLTERPRAIEALRSSKSELASQLPATTQAVAAIKSLHASATAPELKQRLEALLQEWQKKREESLTQQATLIQYKLEDLLSPKHTEEASLVGQFKGFVLGRGLTILYAVAGFLLAFASLSYIARRVETRINESDRLRRHFLQRSFRLGLQLSTVLLALLVTMLILYLRGDWLILGIILLILAGVAWGLSQSLPRYLAVLKLLLNVGSAREGERVIYNGLPWQITSLNMFSTLTNPALLGGSIKIPVQTMLNLVSRPFVSDEPWFPSQVGDIVILDDGVSGKVVLQTPEQVKLKLVGESTKTYSLPAYLEKNPRNISVGFGLVVGLSLAYGHMGQVTQSIPRLLEEHVRSAFAASTHQSILLKLEVYFKEVDKAGLNLEIIAKYPGSAAEDYYTLGCFMQQTAVDACIRFGWRIPNPGVAVFQR